VGGDGRPPLALPLIVRARLSAGPTRPARSVVSRRGRAECMASQRLFTSRASQ
jgi:hypothetical protein